MWIYVTPDTFQIVSPWLLIHPCKVGTIGIEKSMRQPETQALIFQVLGCCAWTREEGSPPRTGAWACKTRGHHVPSTAGPLLRREGGERISFPAPAMPNTTHFKSFVLVLILK